MITKRHSEITAGNNDFHKAEPSGPQAQKRRRDNETRERETGKKVVLC